MLEDLFAEKVPADAGEPVITLDDVCAFLEDSTVRMSELGAGSAAPTTQAYAYDAHGPICMAPAQAAEITNEMLTHASQLPMPPHLPAQLTHPPLTFAPAAALPAAALPAAALSATDAAFSRIYNAGYSAAEQRWLDFLSRAGAGPAHIYPPPPSTAPLYQRVAVRAGVQGGVGVQRMDEVQGGCGAQGGGGAQSLGTQAPKESSVSPI